MMFANIQSFLESIKENAFLNIPITFNVEINPEKNNSSISTCIRNFTNVFTLLEENKTIFSRIFKGEISIDKAEEEIEQFNNSIQSGSNAQDLLFPSGYDSKRGIPLFTKFIMPLCHFSGNNIWILKPNSLNRGRGIHLFNNLNSLKELLFYYSNGNAGISSQKEESKNRPLDNIKYNSEMCEHTLDQFNLNLNNKLLTTSFIIQKYIESPFLINQRKFDLRIWVLITHLFECYVCKYIFM